MAEDSLIRDYLVPPPDTFWEWRDGGEVIAWKDGTTIAFRDELRSILTWLAPQGLPTLDSIALLLSATHDSWNAGRRQERALANMLGERVGESPQIFRDVLSGLHKVRSLPPQLRTPVRSKSVLAEMVLSDCSRVVESDTAMLIVDAMRRGLGDLLEPSGIDFELRGYVPLLLWRDLVDILDGLSRLDDEQLRLRLATGMDELPAAADVELPPAEMARALIDTLQNDVELAGVAKVARQLLSVASLPRRLETQESFHTGGFSDISNRGSMERLLISELAHDDLTLAVRVAMNEALYLRREIPPSTPHNHRALLVDMGIRSWGIPRVFATAVALAFMAGTAKNGSYSCFRAKREAIERAELTTRNGLLQHLACLESELHAAAALPAFVRRLREDHSAEPILLMTEDSLSDPAVQQALRQADLPQLFLATVNRDGTFRLAERGPYGIKPLREAQIGLDQLLQEPEKLVNREVNERLPAIFSTNPFPLLLSHSVDWKRAFYVPDWGVISNTGDGRLLRWQRPGYGAQQICDDIVGNILWVAPAATDGHLSLVVGGSTNATLLRISDDNQIIDSVRLKTRRPGENFCGRNGVLFFIRTGSVDVLDMHSGEVIANLKLPGDIRWNRDRFFWGPTPFIWYALSNDGHSARLDRVECAGELRGLPSLVTMFDQSQVDGPVGVTVDGDLISTTTGIVRKLRHNLPRPLAVPWVSVDGRRVRLKSLRPATYVHRGVVVNTETLGLVTTDDDAADDRALPLARQANLRHRFRAIGIDDRGNLALESRKGYLLVFEVRQGLPVASPRSKPFELRARQSFESDDYFERRYKLWRANWPDGSQADLDSRGLLHLTSSDPAIAPVTLVLAEGELSGWSSGGLLWLWGNRYFVGERSRDVNSAALQHAMFEASVHRFAERLHA